MRLSRSDFVPVLAIVAGGMIGASLSFGLLGSRSEDVAVDVPVSATYESVEVFLRRETFNKAFRLLERDRMAGDYRERAERIRLRRSEEQQRLQERDLQERFEKEIEQVQNRYEMSQEGAMTCLVDGAVSRFSTVDGDPEWVELSSERIESFEIAPLLCIDGVEEEAATQYLLQLASVGPRIVDNLVAEDIEDVEVLLSAAAVRRYGEEASSGAIVLTLKEDRPGR